MSHAAMFAPTGFAAALAAAVLVVAPLVPHPALAQTPQQPNPYGPNCKPFTATQWSTSTTTLPNGQTIAFTQQVDIARSSDAVLRSAEHQRVQGTQRQPEPVIRIFIQDFKHHTFTVILPSSHTASVGPAGAPASRKSSDPTVRKFMQKFKSTKNESKTGLGTKTIDGLTVHGVRTVMAPLAIPGVPQVPGTTHIDWRSNDLCALVEWQSQSAHSHSGSILTDIKVGEPPASLFQIPDGYKVSHVTANPAGAAGAGGATPD